MSVQPSFLPDAAAAPVRTVRVVVPLALDTPYDYLVPADLPPPAAGRFVIVPLGPRRVMGVVWDGASDALPPAAKLKAVLEVLDAPPLPEVSRRFAEWVAAYTLRPLGLVVRMMMSASAAFDEEAIRWGYRLVGPPPERRTAGRDRVLAALAGGATLGKADLMALAGVGAGVVEGLAQAGTLARVALPPAPAPVPRHDLPGAELNADQARAARALRQAVAARAFGVTLLDGVTGSGKTEVYFEAVAECLAAGRQALILLPEIALTNQFLARFAARFGCRPAEWHSGLSPTVRGRVWRQVAKGEARVVAGARSALFLPFAELGLIVVDEEHDASYKQDDRVPYQARDMAVVRARAGSFPVVLASATPSVETLVNAAGGRYGRLELPARFAEARLPDLAAIDMRIDQPDKGRWLSPPLVAAVTETLARGRQALLFLNRRGFAPLTLCRRCGHRIECPQCTATLVEHRFRRQLECHHCGFALPVPKRCPRCEGEGTLVPIGPGVERLAEEVAERWPEVPVAILSSDLVPNLRALRAAMDAIVAGAARLIIGTQLVAKGHNFPELDLVGVVDGDLSLASGDPRAGERTFQLLQQVTGRAGRAGGDGRGLIQTYAPEHPVMRAILAGSRDAFLAREIPEREAGLLPPFGRLAAVVVSAATKAEAVGYARALADAAPERGDVEVLGPAEAALAIIRGRHRMRLLVRAARSVNLQHYCRDWATAAPKPKGSVAASLDIDPYYFL